MKTSVTEVEPVSPVLVILATDQSTKVSNGAVMKFTFLVGIFDTEQIYVTVPNFGGYAQRENVPTTTFLSSSCSRRTRTGARVARTAGSSISFVVVVVVGSGGGGGGGWGVDLT